MDEHTLGLLEFPKIIDELAALCVSPEGAAALRGQPLITEPKPLADAHALALEFRAILESGESLPGFDFPDLGGILLTLGKQGMQLEGEELAAIGRWVLSGLKLKRVVLKSGARRLGAIASEIPDLTPLSRRIFRIIDPEGVLKEKQIPELAAIRERIRRHRADADRSVRGLLEDHDYHAYWQTTTPTQRDGRVVLPLKSQYKGRVKGIVHEMSASGSTLFIEPLEVVEKNNAIVQEENLYRLEVRRILRELTAEVSARAGELSLMVERAAFLDTILARARYALQHSCRRADTSEGAAGSPGCIELRDARHPLLGQRVVPVSVSAGAENRVLIITGPNTGGKTVSLKMVGLLALMNQFGMEIPAAEGSALPLFDEIFADIGDEQSIEQSLSTFSAHIGNLSQIVRRATPRSLILLDELGAGTDPQEGVALAMALLDHFLAAGCLVLVSTHHGILKNYGATRPGAQNASMGFDRQTLGPTYRILMGVPGESHALEIARRSGLPESVLSSAASYLDDERTDISRLVSNLAERHHKLVKAEEEHEALAHDLREKWRTTDLKALTLRQKELELRRHGLKELRDFLGEARREWDALREKGGAPGGADFGRFAAGIQERIAREESRIEQEGEALLPAQTFEPREGLDVVIVRTGRRGKVVRRDKGKRWVVETETLRLSLLPGEMRPAEDAGASPLVTVSYTAASPMDPPVLELHVRGMRLDEAMRLVEKQIDAALIHGLREFSIVHGKGEGILRTAIHAYLRNLNVVADFRFSAPEEGGFGKTIVTLK
ncbi:MAG: endonuclease MutS2 [Spirochaetia bacterium]|jgi:DNA mismatch repair protein MutS2